MTSINHPVGYSSRYARKNVTVYLVLLVILFFSSAVIKANGPIVFTQALFDTILASYGDSAQRRV
jgi:hypothetical protein